MTDQTLDGFVDCHLFEVSGKLVRADGLQMPDVAAPLELPTPHRHTTLLEMPPPAPKPPAELRGSSPRLAHPDALPVIDTRSPDRIELPAVVPGPDLDAVVRIASREPRAPVIADVRPPDRSSPAPATMALATPPPILAAPIVTTTSAVDRASDVVVKASTPAIEPTERVAVGPAHFPPLKRRSRAPLFVLAFGVMVLAGGGAFILMGGLETTEPRSATRGADAKMRTVLGNQPPVADSRGALAQAEHAQSEQAKAERAKAERAEAERAEAERAEAERAEAAQAQAELARAEEAQAELKKAEQAQAELEKAEQAQAELEKAELEKAELEKAELAKAELAQAKVGKTKPTKRTKPAASTKSAVRSVKRPRPAAAKKSDKQWNADSLFMPIPDKR